MSGVGHPIAYAAGRNAHNAGLGPQTNPHEIGTGARRDWYAGWCHRNAECATMGLWSRVNPMADAPPPARPIDHINHG
jgi:hypothetical protein